MNHRTINSDKEGGNDEWYTPPHIIKMTREVMGSIDCDPASCEMAQSYIEADTYFTKDDDGLSKKWEGRVFMNPPFSRNKITRFIRKLLTCEGVTEYICLTNNSTSAHWAQMVLRRSDYICFFSKRLRFISPDLEVADSPTQGQMICYRGKNWKKFIDVFGSQGVILRNEKGIDIMPVQKLLSV